MVKRYQPYLSSRFCGGTYRVESVGAALNFASNFEDIIATKSFILIPDNFPPFSARNSLTIYFMMESSTSGCRDFTSLISLFKPLLGGAVVGAGAGAGVGVVVGAVGGVGVLCTGAGQGGTPTSLDVGRIGGCRCIGGGIIGGPLGAIPG